MYEPFNRTFENKIRNYYKEHKEKIKGGLYIAMTLGILGSGIAYCNYKNNKEAQKSLSVLEEVFKQEDINPQKTFEIPEIEKEYLKDKFNKIYRIKYPNKKEEK